MGPFLKDAAGKIDVKTVTSKHERDIDTAEATPSVLVLLVVPDLGPAECRISAV